MGTTLGRYGGMLLIVGLILGGKTWGGGEPGGGDGGGRISSSSDSSDSGRFFIIFTWKDQRYQGVVEIMYLFIAYHMSLLIINT